MIQFPTIFNISNIKIDTCSLITFYFLVCYIYYSYLNLFLIYYFGNNQNHSIQTAFSQIELVRMSYSNQFNPNQTTICFLILDRMIF